MTYIQQKTGLAKGLLCNLSLTLKQDGDIKSGQLSFFSDKAFLS
jgi:hypothetical protein